MSELAPRILKGIQAQYVRGDWAGKNESGFRPIGTHVLILMDKVAGTTMGGIDLPPGMIEQMDAASESGIIVGVGDAAFRFYDDGTPWNDYKPVPGDRVYTEKYAGRELRGRDGQTYRMMTYTCIAGLEELIEINQPEPAKLAGPKKRSKSRKKKG